MTMTAKRSLSRLRARLGERIEVVAGADVDERLPPVVHLLQLLQDLVGGREGDVRVVAHLGRALRTLRRADDVRRHQAGAHDLAGRFVQPLAVVGHVDRDRGIAGRDDAEEIPLVNELRGDLLHEIARRARVSRAVMCRSSRKIRKMRPDSSFGRRAGGSRMPSGAGRGGGDVFHDPAAVGQHEGHDLLLDAVLEDRRSRSCSGSRRTARGRSGRRDPSSRR